MPCTSSPPSPQRGTFSGIGDLYYVNTYETRMMVADVVGSDEYKHTAVDFRPGDVIIDAGAHIGLFCLLAFQACKHHCTIHAFEPVPANFEALTRNIGLHGADSQITAHRIGLTKPGMPETLDFTCFRNNLSTSSYRPQDKVIANHERIADPVKAMKVLRKTGHAAYWFGRFLPFLRAPIARALRRRAEESDVVPCKTTTLSAMIDDLGLTRIDLIKVDVEGAELDVLQGISEAHWPMIRRVVAEVHDIDGRMAAITGLLERQGFTVTVGANPALAEVYDLHEMVYAHRPEGPE